MSSILPVSFIRFLPSFIVYLRLVGKPGNEVNLELKKIDNWLKLNRLGLNLRKTSYIFINNYPQLPINTTFKITWNNTEVTRATSVKYLGLWFEDNLQFDTHIQKLETDLAKYAGLFCKIRDFLNINTLKTLYYSLVYSKLHYEIIVWGSANKISMHNLPIIVNKIIRSITNNSKFCKISKITNNKTF